MSTLNPSQAAAIATGVYALRERNVESALDVGGKNALGTEGLFAAGADVEYVAGDMRRLPWTDRFDRIVNWSTAFGYFDDATNRAVLDGMAAALRPGGRLAMDLDNLSSFLASYQPSKVVAARDDGDMLVDRYHLNALTGRLEAERTVVRDGRARRTRFVKRLFGFPELRDWLLAAGFTAVAGYGEDGEPLTASHRRMIVVADRP